MATATAPAAHTNLTAETIECNGTFTNEHDDDIPCGYEGDALVDTIARNGFTITVTWTCPNCGRDTTEDRDIRDEQ